MISVRVCQEDRSEAEFLFGEFGQHRGTIGAGIECDRYPACGVAGQIGIHEHIVERRIELR